MLAEGAGFAAVSGTFATICGAASARRQSGWVAPWHKSCPHLASDVGVSGSWLAVLLASSVVVAVQAPMPVQVAVVAGCAIDVAGFVALHVLKNRAWGVALRAHVAMLPIPIMTAFAPTLDTIANLMLLTAYFAPVLPLTVARARTQLSAPRQDASLRAADRLCDGIPLGSIPQQNAAPRSIRPHLYLGRFVNERRRPPHTNPEQARLDREL